MQAVEEEVIVVVGEEHGRAVDPAQYYVHWVAGNDDAGASGHGLRVGDNECRECSKKTWSVPSCSVKVLRGAPDR